jgi:hypothetical protein
VLFCAVLCCFVLCCAVLRCAYFVFCISHPFHPIAKETVCHASVGLHKLYRTGAFFFLLRYPGSNFLPAAELLRATHCQQSHWGGNADAAMRSAGAGAGETSGSGSGSGSGSNRKIIRGLALKHLSVLGAMLPEALLLLLEEGGGRDGDYIYGGGGGDDCARRFAGVFTGDCDTPEVIWTHSMRVHLMAMLLQHLSDARADDDDDDDDDDAGDDIDDDDDDNEAGSGRNIDRLREHTGWEFTFCPIPPVRYARLQGELFAHRYYLGNLCDQDRYPDW